MKTFPVIVDTSENAESFKKDFDGFPVDCFPWHINTKYYEADVHLLRIPRRDLVSEHFAEIVNAVVIYFECQKSSFQKVEHWMPFIEKYSPDVKIMVCDKASDDFELTKDTLLKWCIENEFELVELSVTQNDDDDFKETIGIERIKQALSAHTWPSMQLKSSHVYKPSPRFEEALRREFERDMNSITSQVNNLNVNNLFEENSESSFETLFSQFSELKNKAQQLNGDERRRYAEKVTIAFWKALGGDDNEIESLDSD
ncbi:alpha- and gamma-adaptin-binding protein p34-like protein [Leptotrombidium deliense]|uniref:Alpha-and gamma-adaptin-binding protein p34-like protein n=1 Tax=Leptotrombidium deliense TaxID=299467 RepID=A0A443SST9_9ACAR|nr:alpha- and gamma-adaptin-binding protein p34-like protein [Leptotrombidium deliense]